MQIGVVFPQTELGGDPAAVRTYATTVEGLGYSHISIYDHVVGADPATHKGWGGAYDLHSTFHEVFVVFGFIAALTNLELCTSVVIMPQRQTVLVAKQAAEVDLLTGGKFRLGVGIGWNAVEFEALGKDFTDRGARLTEQVELMRRLWTEPSLTFEGRYERVTGAGLAPMPVQRPIPVWVGARVDAGLRRAGRIADGWFPMEQPGPGLEHAISVVNEAASAAGRDPATIGMEGRINLDAQNAGAVEELIAAWREAGATHLSINTMKAGFATVDEHLAVLAAAASTAVG